MLVHMQRLLPKMLVALPDTARGSRIKPRDILAMTVAMTVVLGQSPAVGYDYSTMQRERKRKKTVVHRPFCCGK